MTDNFVNLHNYTHYSFYQSLVGVDGLFDKAKELGQKSISITDGANQEKKTSVRVKLNKNEPIKEKIAEIRENNKSKPSLKKVYPSSKLLEILEEPGMNLLSLEKRVGYSRGAITARLKRDGCFEKAIQVIEANKVKLGQKCKYSSSEIIDLLMKEGVTLKEFAKTLGWSTSHLNRKLKRSGYFIKDISKQVTNNNLTLDIELKEKDK